MNEAHSLIDRTNLIQIVWESTKFADWVAGGVCLFMATTELFCPKKFSLGRRRTRKELRLGLTPTAVYMLHYWIKPILRNSYNGWASLNIAEFARRPHSPCLRACREAYSRLYAVQNQLGITLVHNHDQVPKIYVCLTQWLDAAPDSDRLPLFFKNGDQKRHLRNRHEEPDLPLSLNAQLYVERPRFPRPITHDADLALILYPSGSQKQTEDPFQSSPKKNPGFAANKKWVKPDQRLTGWILSQCRNVIPGFYHVLWTPRATKVVFGYIKKSLSAAHDKEDIIGCFIESAEALHRQHFSSFDAGLIAIKASNLLKTYTIRGTTPQARLASFALRKKAENISAAQADADEIIRHLLSFQNTKLIDLTTFSFLTLSVFEDPKAKLYLLQRVSPSGRKFLYKTHCRILRDIYYRSRLHQLSLNLMSQAA